MGKKEVAGVCSLRSRKKNENFRTIFCFVFFLQKKRCFFKQTWKEIIEKQFYELKMLFEWFYYQMKKENQTSFKLKMKTNNKDIKKINQLYIFYLWKIEYKLSK